MRTRDAWLAAIAATLGLTEDACRAKDAAPAAAREVPSASASASAPVVAATTPPSASVEIAPSATASAVASASSAPKASGTVLAQLGDLDPKVLEQLQAACGAPAISTGTIGIGSIGTSTIGHHNLSCGVSTRDLSGGNTGPRAEVVVNVNGGAAGDDRVMASIRPRLRNCANHALQQNPTQQGRLIISAVVGANGTVSSAAAMTNTGLSEACSACMVQAVRTAQFPAGAERTIRILVNQTLQQSP